jgi:septal ring factor EnvC (AmiA/AmiB activator)
MRRFTIASVVSTALLGLTGLYLIAGRNPSEIRGFLKASAGKTIDDIKDQIPNEIHDRKLDSDLAQVRQEVIDRQVQLNLSKSSLATLANEVRQLEGRTQRRERILAEAFPILESATRENHSNVLFTGQQFTLDEFKRQIDDLLTEQDRESRQLEIKKSGLERIERGAREGEQAVLDMKVSLDTAEQEVLVLRSRREQAEAESKTLDMVASVSGRSGEATASVGKSLEDLKGGVAKLEARNEARRSNAPVSERTENALSKGWSRLESLKAIHDKLQVRTDRD